MLNRFVRSPTSTAAPCTDDPALVEDVRGLVKVRDGNQTRDLVIGTQADGALTVVDHDRDKLSQRVHAQLAFHEVASGRTLALEVSELYVFDLQVLELLMDAPGLNDAMYLYGSLRGPYPALPGRPVLTVDGQLTVTRSDLLGALVDGTADAFCYRPEGGGSRCVHALVPGERDSVIDGGRGVVLAFPLAPADSFDAVVSNDRVAAQLLYDVLGALYRDMGVANQLPVPSRAAVEHELKAQGWTIEGDTAVRAKRSGILGALMPEREKRALPREGVLDEYIVAATAALPTLGPPSPEALALRRRRGEVAVRPIPKAPSMPAQSSPAPPPRQPRPHVPASPTEWMKDFVEAHRAQGRATPKVVAPARAVTPSKPPAWMDDFAPEKSGGSDRDD